MKKLKTQKTKYIFLKTRRKVEHSETKTYKFEKNENSKNVPKIVEKNLKLEKKLKIRKKIENSKKS